MKCIPSDLVAEGSGSIGMLTMQRCRGGTIIRSTPRAIGRITSFREQRRTVFSNAVKRWQVLPAETRASWGRALGGIVGYGLRGPMNPLTAYSYFVAQYCIDSVCTGTTFDEPPMAGVVRELTDAGVTAHSNPTSMVFSWSPEHLTNSEILMAAIGFAASPVSNVGIARWIQVFPVGAGASSPAEIFGGHPEYAPYVQVGRAIVSRLSIYDAVLRRLSRPALSRTVVVA